MNADYAKELANRKTDYTVRSSKKALIDTVHTGQQCNVKGTQKV